MTERTRSVSAPEQPEAATDPQTSETPKRCSCGSPDTFSLNPSEVVVHGVGGCRIWPDGGTTDAFNEWPATWWCTCGSSGESSSRGLAEGALSRHREATHAVGVAR